MSLRGAWETPDLFHRTHFPVSFPYRLWKTFSRIPRIGRQSCSVQSRVKRSLYSVQPIRTFIFAGLAFKAAFSPRMNSNNAENLDEEWDLYLRRLQKSNDKKISLRTVNWSHIHLLRGRWSLRPCTEHFLAVDAR